MQEHNFNIQDAFRNGLRPFDDVPVNAPFMEVMQNLRPTERGALTPVVPYRATTALLKDVVYETNWPFPQIFKTEGGLLIFWSNRLFDVIDEDTESSPYPWTVTENTNIRNARSISSTKSITGGGGPWHVASFLDLWVATNAMNLVFKSPYTSSPDAYSRSVRTDTSLLVNSVVNDNNRLVLAGLSGAYFSTSQWRNEVFKTWQRHIPADYVTYYGHALDTNWIMWGERGGGAGNYPFHLLLAVLGMPDEDMFDAYKAEILQALESGAIGMMPLRQGRAVLVTKMLGERLIAYGEHGVSELSKDGMIYREVRFTPCGIQGRGNVAGSDDEHVFVGDDGELWRFLANEERPHRLGYKEFLADLDLETTQVSYDPTEREYWITDGSTCYVKTPQGLGGPMSYHPTSMVRHKLGLVAAWTDDADGAVKPVSFRTVPLDIGERATKHVTNVQLASAGISAMTAKVGYTFETDETVRWSIEKPFNPNGVAHPTVSFLEGKIHVAGSAAATPNGRVSRLTVRYNAEDARHRRGTVGRPEES